VLIGAPPGAAWSSGCESTAVLAGRDAILDYTQHWLDAVMADQACAK
jgi:hypothetical protein